MRQVANTLVHLQRSIKVAIDGTLHRTWVWVPLDFVREKEQPLRWEGLSECRSSNHVELLELMEVIRDI